MKRIGIIALALIFCASMVFAGGGSAGGGGGRTEITIINLKVEIDEALKAYAQVYERQTGVRVNIRSFGGDADYGTSLDALLNSGMEPEIFVISGPTDYDRQKFAGRVTDLSDQPWARDTDVAYMDGNRVVGFPYAIEGYGLGYNKALLDRAGINPATLTNINAVRAAFQRIDGMKAQLGIDAVVSMAAGPTMTWVTGDHGFNVYLAGGLPYNNSTRFINLLNAGMVDNARLTAFAEYYNLLFQFANRNTLLAGGYDQQVGDFAAQKTVFIHQGNWIDPNLAEMGANFEVGYAPHAFLTEDTNGIFVSSPSWYMVNAKSAQPEEAKKFLVAMWQTTEGRDFMVNKAGMITPFKSVSLTPSGGLSRSVQQWAAAGRIYSWQQYKMPDGFGMQTLGPIFAEMAAGRITVQQFVQQVTAAVARIGG